MTEEARSQSVPSLVSIFLQVSEVPWYFELSPTKLEIAPLQNSLPLLFFFTGRMSDTSSTPNSELEEQWQRWVDAALPDDDSPPPLHADPARREIDSQRKYIDALEQLAVGGGAQDSVPPGTALMLRQQNKLLVTKCAAAGPAPRRARRVAQRAAGQRAVALRASQHARARARTLRATAGGARKAERSERLQAQNARLRSQLRERDQQLVSSCRRIAELEQLVVSLRTVLRQSVRGIALAGLEPDPPLLQGPAVNLA